MKTRAIGDLQVSVVGLGCNNFGGRLDALRTEEVVHAALDAGITFFDTADIYGETRSEEFLGRALGARRREVIVATKFGLPLPGGAGGARPEYVRSALEASLRRLGTDYVDLYQLHRPDPGVPLADTLGALNDLVSAGKVRAIGSSNFDAALIRTADKTPRAGAARFLSVQNEYSLLQREPENGVLHECAERGLAFLPYFPLASGLLTGKYVPGRSLPESTRLTEANSRLADRFLKDENVAAAARLAEYASSRGRSLLELAFAWLLAKPAVTSVIAGATSAAQVRANAAAALWSPSAEEIAAIDALAPAPPV